MRSIPSACLLLVVLWSLVFPSLALAGPDAAQALFAADRLVCAFLYGSTAGFEAKGITVRPPLDPSVPGLVLTVADRAKNRATLDEDGKQTPGYLVKGPATLTAFAQNQTGDVTVVTVLAEYPGPSENFPAVVSFHAGSDPPRASQRYGYCRVATEEPAQPAEPKVEKKPGH